VPILLPNGRLKTIPAQRKKLLVVLTTWPLPSTRGALLGTRGEQIPVAFT
jgi:hypothetical protein